MSHERTRELPSRARCREAELRSTARTAFTSAGAARARRRSAEAGPEGERPDERSRTHTRARAAPRPAERRATRNAEARWRSPRVPPPSRREAACTGRVDRRVPAVVVVGLMRAAQRPLEPAERGALRAKGTGGRAATRATGGGFGGGEGPGWQEEHVGMEPRRRARRGTGSKACGRAGGRGCDTISTGAGNGTTGQAAGWSGTGRTVRPAASSMAPRPLRGLGQGG